MAKFRCLQPQDIVTRQTLVNHGTFRQPTLRYKIGSSNKQKGRGVRAFGADATACIFLNIDFCAELRIPLETSWPHEAAGTGIFELAYRRAVMYERYLTSLITSSGG